jgi:hypothetical protein
MFSIHRVASTSLMAGLLIGNVSCILLSDKTTGRCEMKTFTPLIAMAVMVFLVVPALWGEDAYSLEAYYEAAIEEEMIQCRQMASLLTARSPNLRKKGHREAIMAMYLNIRLAISDFLVLRRVLIHPLKRESFPYLGCAPPFPLQ